MELLWIDVGVREQTVQGMLRYNMCIWNKAGLVGQILVPTAKQQFLTYGSAYC